MPHDPAALRVPAGVRVFAAPTANAASGAPRPTPPSRAGATTMPEPATSSFSAVEAGRTQSVKNLAAAFGAMSPGGVHGSAGAPRGLSSSAAERVRVIVRLRPQQAPGPVSVELEGGCRVAVRRSPSAAPALHTFDQALGPDATLIDVSTALDVASLAADVAAGKNAALLAYGQTGAGKTHTMSGEAGGGLAVAVARALFASLAEGEEGGATITTTRVTLSVVQVYKEAVSDLLVEEGGSGSAATTDLPLRECRSTGGAVPIGARSIPVSSPVDVIAALASAEARRATGATAANATSSRSHSITCLAVTRGSASGVGPATVGRFYVADLAGSERQAASAALACPESAAARAAEAVSINLSLVTLGQVFAARAAGAAFTPVRDSKLTRLLAAALGGTGNARAALVVCVRPEAPCAGETAAALEFGARARQVATAARVNRVVLAEAGGTWGGEEVDESESVVAAAAAAAAAVAAAADARAAEAAKQVAAAADAVAAVRKEATATAAAGAAAVAAAEAERDAARAAADAVKGEAQEKLAALEARLSAETRATVAATARAAVAETGVASLEVALAAATARVAALERAASGVRVAAAERRAAATRAAAARTIQAAWLNRGAAGAWAAAAKARAAAEASRAAEEAARAAAAAQAADATAARAAADAQAAAAGAARGEAGEAAAGRTAALAWQAAAGLASTAAAVDAALAGLRAAFLLPNRELRALDAAKASARPLGGWDARSEEEGDGEEERWTIAATQATNSRPLGAAVAPGPGAALRRAAQRVKAAVGGGGGGGGEVDARAASFSSAGAASTSRPATPGSAGAAASKYGFGVPTSAALAASVAGGGLAAPSPLGQRPRARAEPREWAAFE